MTLLRGLLGIALTTFIATLHAGILGLWFYWLALVVGVFVVGPLLIIFLAGIIDVGWMYRHFLTVSAADDFQK